MTWLDDKFQEYQVENPEMTDAEIRRLIFSDLVVTREQTGVYLLRQLWNIFINMDYIEEETFDLYCDKHFSRLYSQKQSLINLVRICQYPLAEIYRKEKEGTWTLTVEKVLDGNRVGKLGKITRFFNDEFKWDHVKWKNIQPKNIQELRVHLLQMVLDDKKTIAHIEGYIKEILGKVSKTRVEVKRVLRDNGNYDLVIENIPLNEVIDVERKLGGMLI